ncbi:MAG: polyprenyl synthetase family protein [Clostridiales bacterium]|jgi:geranylgeranyl diphosphate synthase type II|nr:polyprenyl synthetase family protein [Eubacteriales bacterium]MDH7565228.1 polyprenyl synthetase family protein [Clostridiales bacterium]
MDFKSRYGEWLNLINQSLEAYVQEKNTPEKSIYRSMRYSLLAGGKRLRPVLALAVCELLNGDMREVIPFACALEMIHTYSLIHDDLPAMDNDDYRRGRLTNHKVFGEAQAILAGDALLNYAFELMLSHALSEAGSTYKKTKAALVIASASGAGGMIGGQVMDIEWEGKRIEAEALEHMHKCKTGALIKAAVVSSAILCNAGEKELEVLEKYAEKLGLAFQIKDDILDIEGSAAVMGKEAGSDARKNKSTYVTVYGISQAGHLLDRTIESALSDVIYFGEKAYFLKGLAEYVAAREN